MPSDLSTAFLDNGRTLSVLCVVVLMVLLAGCGGGDGGGTTTTLTMTTTTTTTAELQMQTETGTPATETAAAFKETTRPARSFPDPPADLTSTTAKQTALEYEEVYVYNRLRKQEYGLWGVASEKDPSATIINQTDTGLYVRVRMPYSYSVGNTFYSNTTRAVYFVSPDSVRRVTGVGPVLK